MNLDQARRALRKARDERNAHSEGCMEWDYEIGCLECEVLDQNVKDALRRVRELAQ